MNTDLFGEEIKKDVLLREKFIEPPFTVLDSKSGNWQRRKKQWKRIGIKSEVGRTIDTPLMPGTSREKIRAAAIVMGTNDSQKQTKETVDNRENYISIFDPALCELIYKWF